MTRALLALALVAATFPARAEGPPDLAVDVRTTAAIAGGSLAIWGASELLKGEIAPSSCRWCEPPALDRRARAQLAWSNPGAARLLSDVLVVALPASLAAGTLLAARDLRHGGEDVLVAVEAIALAGLGTQIVKLAVARRRPYAWALGTRAGPDDDLSFFSGHASAAFATAGAFGTVARLRGYRAWPVVYAAGFSTATAIAYLRVAADKHWLSDVTAGAVFGTGVGIAVPLVLHRGQADRKLTVAPLPLGEVGLGISGAF